MENKVDELLKRIPIIVNIGVLDFAENLQAQGASTVQLEWSPPAGGDREMLDLLDNLV